MKEYSNLDFLQNRRHTTSVLEASPTGHRRHASSEVRCVIWHANGN